jgi:uncharacterized membrane protein YedE/YeeE
MATESKTAHQSNSPHHEKQNHDSIETSQTNDTIQNATHSWDWFEESPAKLFVGLIFGVIFGFLLQKGGVSKFDILIGVLLLENFVVVKVMLTAIIVGIAGSFLLRRLDFIELQISETNYGANIIGGLIFGIGFGLLAYCPGTNAAAVGQGNFDALIGVVGLVFGSYLYALASRKGRSRPNRWGRRGKLTIPEMAGVSPGIVVAVAVPTLAVILLFLELSGY